MISFNLNLIIFFTCSLIVILIVEKIEEKVVQLPIFRGFIEEMKKVEDELNEYYFYAILAIAMRDKEAYEGYQSLMDEKYWPYFFRSMLFHTSLFFVLFSPYMILTEYLLKDIVPNAFSWSLFTAIGFFTFKIGYELLIKGFINAWKARKEQLRGI